MCLGLSSPEIAMRTRYENKSLILLVILEHTGRTLGKRDGKISKSSNERIFEQVNSTGKCSLSPL